MKNLKKHSFILLLVTLLVLYLVLKDNFSQIMGLLLSMKLGYLLLAVIFIFLYWVFKSIAMYIVARHYSKSIKGFNIFKQIVITQFFNGITPFSTGGQPMQIYMLKKSNISLAKSTNIVMQDFMMYQVALVLYGIFAVVANYRFGFFESVPLLRRLVFLGFLVNTLVCLMVVILCFSKKTSKKIFDLCFKILSKIKFIKNPSEVREKWNNRLLEFQESADLFMRNKSLFFKGTILNILALTSYYIIPFFIILGMRDTTNMSVLNVIVSSAYTLVIGSFVPIPGGTGGIEYGFLKFFGNVNTGSTLSAMLLMWRFITYYLGMIIGGVMFSFYRGDEN